ncbi:MAG: DUF87 domain-containing protein [Lachnospiraceae bacterium]|nr:DUF87 domain-containing protein [Lachnospiraceae bacterium]
MRLIPGKTKVQVELFKGVTLWDIIIGGVALTMLLLVLISTLPGKMIICTVIFFIAALLLVRLDTEPNYVMVMHMLLHFGYVRRYHRAYDDEMLKKKVTGELGKEFLEDYREKNETLDEEIKAEAESSEEPSGDPASEEAESASGETPAEEPAEAAGESAEDSSEEPAEEPAKDAGKKGKGKQAKKPAAKEGAEAPAKQLSERELRKQEDKILKSKTATEEEKDAVWLARAQRSAEKKKAKAEAKGDFSEDRSNAAFMDQIIAFTGVKDGYIEYGGKYFGAAIEIDPVEFRFFSQHRRDNSIEFGVGRVLRSVHADYAANIVKIERPVLYDRYLEKEEQKIEQIRKSYESGMLNEEELKARIEVVRDRIDELKDLCFDHKVVTPFYYIVLFEKDKSQLELQVKAALANLTAGEMTVHRLDDKELAVFLKYTNQIDFDEREIDQIAPEDYGQWAMPQSLNFKFRTVEVNNIITHNMRVVTYPSMVGDAWLAGVFSLPGTKAVIKCSPMDRGKAIRSIDRSLQELRGQYNATSVDSKRIELENHIATLSELLATLQGEGEELMECNIYVTVYDIMQTRNTPSIKQPPESILPMISGMKKNTRRTWQENNFRLNNMEFNQMSAFIGSQISAYDPEAKQGRGIPSNSIAACYPWIYAHISDEGGFKLGASEGVPVFIDFFRRDSERVNSNMVIIGKSGSGKSYATKSLLSNLAAEDAKIFILDPENEYAELANNLHGKVINVANAQFGRLNPFHIITALDDDEGDADATGSFATHLQFLEEFYRQILPEIDKDSLEYLNTLTERLYTNKGITPESDLSRLRPEDYPIFDDLYDAVLAEFERTDNEYIRSMLRTLVNYVSKFSTGGRNANIWNGPSTVTTDENFTVFNFQAMLSNRNTTIANAQMLLVLKYIDNEIIKNREYNERYHLKRKVVVVIDEAHVFIDTKFPVALDFMFQLAKRIRKYNGMQIVITQNIKDFVGSEEIARKSTAIINACQYSFIFALAPNDIQDLCKLYEKAGGINENEQEQITQAPRGQAFTIMSPTSRSTFRVEVPKNMVDMFQDRDYVSKRFSGEEGIANWESFVAGSREAFEANSAANKRAVEEKKDLLEDRKVKRVLFEEITEEEARTIRTAPTPVIPEPAPEKLPEEGASAAPEEFEEAPDLFPESLFDPEDLSDEEFEALMEAKRAEKRALEAAEKAASEEETVLARPAVAAEAPVSVPAAPVHAAAVPEDNRNAAEAAPVLQSPANESSAVEAARVAAMDAVKEVTQEFMKALAGVTPPAPQEPAAGSISLMQYDDLKERLLEELKPQLRTAESGKAAPEPEVDVAELTAKIRSQVLEEVMEELKESGALTDAATQAAAQAVAAIPAPAPEPAPAPVPAPAPAPVSEEPKESESVALGSIFDFAMEEKKTEADILEEAEAAEEEAGGAFDFASLFDPDVPAQDPGEPDEDSFDIMALLRSEAAQMTEEDTQMEIDDIDELVADGEVAQITLDELAALVRMLRKKRAAA